MRACGALLIWNQLTSTFLTNADPVLARLERIRKEIAVTMDAEFDICIYHQETPAGQQSATDADHAYRVAVLEESTPRA